MAKSIEYAQIADLYDTYVRTAFDIPFFLGEVGKTSGEVLELMSGTGRVSVPLIEAGVRLTCVDSSPEMLAVLRSKLEKRGLAADVYEMDVRKLALGKQFDLIIIPFHSFSELLSSSDQCKVLAGIRDHLTDTGVFICTLHNPPIRLKSVDGRLRLLAKHPREGYKSTLLVWCAENYDQASCLVSGVQLYEEYDAKGSMMSKRLLEARFCLIQKSRFEELASSAGLKTAALYGDYSYSEFREDTSPFQIWMLQKRR